MNIVKLNDGSEEIVTDEELEAAAEMYDRIMNKPSPGPWHDGNGQLVVSALRPICDVMTGNRADAVLIAAAPEMAAVLRDVAQLLPCAGRLHPKDLHALQTRVCAALAKAGVT